MQFFILDNYKTIFYLFRIFAHLASNQKLGVFCKIYQQVTQHQNSHFIKLTGHNYGKERKIRIPHPGGIPRP